MSSHLLQMRGLKQKQPFLSLILKWSHLLQMRGLKLFTTKDLSKQMSRIFYRCVD